MASDKEIAMAFNLKNRHLLSLVHHSEREINYLLDLSRDLKRAKYAGTEQPQLKGKNIALIFEKTSTRTRCAFEVAAHDQGAQVTYIDPNSSQIGHKESMKDTARVLGRMYDAIEYRGFKQSTVQELADYAGVPVFNGDLIQGNPIADYQAAKGYKEGKSNPAVDCLNAMHYEVGTLGNHEFNYGLDYLADAIKQAKFPIINANVVKVGTEEPYFTPYVIQTKEVVDSQGKTHKLNIGYIGFVPPQIMVWDKANLQGKVETRDIVKTAQKYVPEMKQKGADIIVVLFYMKFKFIF
jgi:hypothetical protein